MDKIEVVFYTFKKSRWADTEIVPCHENKQKSYKKRAITEIHQTGGSEDIFFWKPHGMFRFFTLSLEIPGKTKLHP